MKAWYDGGVAPASSTGSDDGVANSGDDDSGSNGEESERDMGASSVGRREREELDFYRGEGGRGKVGRFFMDHQWREGVMEEEETDDVKFHYREEETDARVARTSGTTLGVAVAWACSGAGHTTKKGREVGVASWCQVLASGQCSARPGRACAEGGGAPGARDFEGLGRVAAGRCFGRARLGFLMGLGGL